jgi:hypothetical protein
LVTSSGTVTGGSSPAVAETAILDTLAVVELSDEPTLDSFFRHSVQETGLVVAIGPLGAADDLNFLAGAARSAHTAVFVAMDAPTWVRTRPRPTAELTAAQREAAALGWRFVPATATDTIDQLWPLAGRSDLSVGVK